MKTFLAIICSLIVACGPALATLTATVTPGYQLSTGERPTTSTLNLLAQPSVLISGTVDGSTGLTPGSVYGNYLADSCVDDVTTYFNSSSPRAIAIKKGGVRWENIHTNALGIGLSGGWDPVGNSGTNVNVNIDGTTIVLNTNNALKISDNFLVGIFNIYPTTAGYTNAWGYTNAFAITNYNMPTVSNLWTYTTNISGGTTNITTNTTVAALDGNEIISIKSDLQNTNTTMNLNSVSQFVVSQFTSGTNQLSVTNFNRVAAFASLFGTNTVDIAPPGPGRFYYNSNSYAMIVRFNGTWSVNNDTWTIYVADSVTNTVLPLVTNQNAGTTISQRVWMMPPGYGVYGKRISGSGGSHCTGTFAIEAIPY